MTNPQHRENPDDKIPQVKSSPEGIDNPSGRAMLKVRRILGVAARNNPGGFTARGATSAVHGYSASEEGGWTDGGH